jgi:hypothetical protein
MVRGYDAPGLHHKNFYPGGKPEIDERHDWCFLVTPFSFLKGTAIVSCPAPVISFVAIAYWVFLQAGWDSDKLTYEWVVPESIGAAHLTIGTFLALLVSQRSLGTYKMTNVVV